MLFRRIWLYVSVWLIAILVFIIWYSICWQFSGNIITYELSLNSITILILIVFYHN